MNNVFELTTIEPIRRSKSPVNDLCKRNVSFSLFVFC